MMGSRTLYDHIENPIGYTKGQIEVVDFIEDKDLNPHLAAVVQYVVRERYKNGLVDLKKALWWLRREILRRERLQQRQEVTALSNELEQKLQELHRG